jgi:hypothetical protein
MNMAFFTSVLFAIIAFAFPTVHGSDKRDIGQVVTDFAGGLMINAPANNSFVAVGINFTVPKISAPKSSNSSGTHNVSIWTALGMQNNLELVGGNGNFLRAGVNISVSILANGSDSTTYNAWYEWLPDYPAVTVHNIDPHFDIAAGDVITTTIDAKPNTLNKTIGSVTLKNVRTKRAVEIGLTPSNTTSPTLLGSCVDLIVSGDMNIANFGTVKFDVEEIGTVKRFGEAIGDLFDDSELFIFNGTGGPITETNLKVSNVTSSVEIKYAGK